MLYRFFIEALPAAGDVTLSGEEFHHAARVVRVREREEIELFDGRGRGARAIVEKLDRDSLTATILSTIESTRETPLDLTLAMAVIQLEKFELVLQKATELGVRSIVPMQTDRGEVREERYRGKAERWSKIVFEATKQSGRLVIPSVAPPAKFDELIAGAGTRLLFDADAPPSPPGSVTQATIFIGPEGGWTERELELARNAEATFRRLGPRRLRAETAAIAAIAKIGVEAGDLG